MIVKPDQALLSSIERGVHHRTDLLGSLESSKREIEISEVLVRSLYNLRD